jgi:hypothetical protein
MAAKPKLTYGRETRLFALLVLGESFEAACRAIDISSTAIRRRAARDSEFAERLQAARENRPADLSSLEPPHWSEIAAQIEREHREDWVPPPLDLGGEA